MWVSTLPGDAGDEAGLDLGAQAGLVGLDRQQVVGAGIADGGGDGAVGGDGIDRDQRAAQPVPLGEAGQQHRDGGEFVGFVGHRLLTQHQAGGGGEGRDQVDRRRARGAVMRAAGGLAVDGDEVGAVGPGGAHPGGEGGGEQGGVDAVHQDGQPASARDAEPVGQMPTQEGQMRLAPGGDVIVVVAVGDGAANHQQQDLGQRMGDAADIARVGDGGEVIQQDSEAGLAQQIVGGAHGGGLQIGKAASNR